MGIIYSEAAGTQAVELVQTCMGLGLKAVAKRVSSEKDLPEAVQSMNDKIDCFLMVPDPKIYFPQSVKYLLAESMKDKIPVVGLSRYYTKDGALLSFDCDYQDLGSQAGEIALKVLDGAKPKDITPVLPRKLNYSLNTSVADKLGIKMDPEIVKGATYIYDENSK